MKGNYHSVEKIFLFACVTYIAYIIAAVLISPDWEASALASVRPVMRWDPVYLTMIVGLVGTSVAPWMQFYLQAAVVEKGITVKDYAESRIEVIVGCIVMVVVAFFIIVACAAAIWQKGPREITSAAEAAKALRPFGEYAYLLFCAGLLNASLFAASILPLSTAYSVCEGLGFESGVNKRFREAPVFYWLYTGLIVLGAARRPHPGVPAGQDDPALAGRQRRPAAARAGVHGPAGEQRQPDARVDQLALLQRSWRGSRCSC